MKKQSGFTLVEGLLIVLILAVVGFAGYYVLSNQTKDNDNDKVVVQNSQEDANDDAVEKTPITTEPEISADWKRFEAANNAFSIKLADGMTGINAESEAIIVVKEYSDNDQPANIEIVDGYGSDAHTVLSIYQTDDPQFFAYTEKIDLVEVPFTTSSGLTGIKQSFKTPYDPPCEGLGCYVGTEYIYYEFKNPETGETIVIVNTRRKLNPETAKIYDLKADDPDLSTIVDAIAKTLKI